MDTRKFDAKGKTICPECGKHYYPVLGMRDPNVVIQRQFPNATQVQREQLLTGICSQKCWNKYLGLSPAKPKKKKVRK